MSPAAAKPVKTPKPTPYNQLRYNHVRARGSHNSYQRDEDIADQMVYWRLRHIELDIHTSRDRTGVLGHYVETAEDGDWFVYHFDYRFEDPSVQRLSDGLALLAGFHRAVPEHEVVTVALDVKNHFDTSGHTPAKLDALIERFLPNLVYKPADLLASVQNPTKLQDGANMWPLLQDVRGKFIFILTTGGLSAGSQLSQYIADGAARTRVCFVAPEIDKASQVTATENQDAVFFNMTVGNAPRSAPMCSARGWCRARTAPTTRRTSTGRRPPAAT